VPKIVVPKVFLIAETLLHEEGRGAFLAAIGAPADWRTDAASDAEELCEIAGKSCYLSFSADLNKNLTRVGGRSNFDYLQAGIVGTRHGSVLEHATVTLAFVDVSRVFTHELVRHRAGAAYSQVSGRYVRTDELGYFLPSAIAANEEAAAIFAMAFKSMEIWAMDLAAIFDIDNLKNFNLKKTLTSAFRRLIGNGQANHIVATFNHRALRNIIELRTSRHAEEEIRLVFSKVFALVRCRYPALYADARVESVDAIDEVVFAAGKI
jgi:thymidylate synthase (FAD)